MCGCLSWAPYWEPGLQPRPMPWRGMEPATPCFAGWHSIHWATPAKAVYTFFNKMWTYGVRSQESGDQAPGSKLFSLWIWVLATQVCLLCENLSTVCLRFANVICVCTLTPFPVVLFPFPRFIIFLDREWYLELRKEDIRAQIKS